MSICIKNTEFIDKIIETAKFKTEKYGDVVIFTNGNDWYIPTLIHNLLKSMKIHEPLRKIIVFCSDKSGYNKCEELGFKYFEFVDIPDLMVSEALSNTDASTQNYTRLSFVKIVLMKYILEKGYTPLYLDPDMAFLHPAIDDILSYLDKENFVCAGTRDYLNSNIMVANQCELTNNLFDLDMGQLNNIINGKNTYGDEDLLRPRLVGKPLCVSIGNYIQLGVKRLN